jgi:excisionase family DNA binding protein
MEASDPTTELRGSSARHEVDVATRVTMTLAEAAEILGIHRTTAWSLHKRGEFPVPVLKIGSNLRVVKAHLQQFMETGEPVVPGTLVGVSVSIAS